MQLVQQVQVDIRNKDHLRIGRRFGSPSVRRKSEVARGEDPGTCVLNVHVMHFGQVAHTAGDHYEAFVFNGAGVGTDLYAGSREDIERILNGDTETLRKLLDAGRYGIGGASIFLVKKS